VKKTNPYLKLVFPLFRKRVFVRESSHTEKRGKREERERERERERRGRRET